MRAAAGFGKSGATQRMEERAYMGKEVRVKKERLALSYLS